MAHPARHEPESLNHSCVNNAHSEGIGGRAVPKAPRHDRFHVGQKSAAAGGLPMFPTVSRNLLFHRHVRGCRFNNWSTQHTFEIVLPASRILAACGSPVFCKRQLKKELAAI